MRLGSCATTKIEMLEPRQLFSIPSAWNSVINNPFMPAIAGMKWVYSGKKDGQRTADIQIVSSHKHLVDGVATTAILDRGYVAGKLEEKTFDYFAQDLFGNVWYFGEDTEELKPNGQVDNTEGTWHAGVNGAKPGIVMEASPVKGDFYHQEFAGNVAQDEAQILGLHQSTTVPFGTFNDSLLTKEFSPLEPGVIEHKYYVAGIGFVSSISTAGESEVLNLVSFTP